MDSSEVEALAADLNAAAIALLRRLRRADAELGVTPARLSVLSVLVFGGPRTVSQLADAEQVSGPTMSRLVRGLEDCGLARRDVDARDGRATLVTPTAQGVRVMLRGRQLRVRQLARHLAGLSDDDLRLLRRATAIVRAVGAPRP